MNRRAFIAAGSGFCIAALLGESCSSAYYAQLTVEGNKISVRKSEFQYLKKEEVQERAYVFVKPVGAGFPICLYKKGDDYTACLMRCTHQSCEVEVQGSRYKCPCHGSEFSTDGALLEGPAERPLKTFKTEQDETFVYILVA